MPSLLKVAVTFPNGYSGSTLGDPEEVPSFARVYEAFVAAAAGGPRARADGRVLVADDEDRLAVRWLEDRSPVGVRVPEARLSAPTARRYRWRASPVTLQGDAFESRSALDGPVTYYWPSPTAELADRLRSLAAEITHVGRADSIARVRVEVADPSADHGEMHEPAPGRGVGLVSRVAGAGRFVALERAHRDASAPGGHGSGPMGKQSPDLLVTGASEDATTLVRFVPVGGERGWPFAEVMRVPLTNGGRGVADRLVRDPASRIAGAVAVHRSLIRALEEDVPSFVTGRDGDGPLRGAGHLAIHLLPTPDGDGAEVLLGLPQCVAGAERLRLLEAVAAIRPRIAGRVVRLGRPVHRSAAAFWGRSSPTLRLATPMVLDAPGVPRRGPWSLEDGVLCSIGYAFRGTLERDGFAWATGWEFRRRLVAHLRETKGVQADARRVHRSASRYAHRAAAGDLLVAVDAAVRLGDLAAPLGGFVAIGRARHLGGGLLVPEDVA